MSTREGDTALTIVSAAGNQPDTVISGLLTLLFAIAVGVIATNVFAPQPLVGLIGPSLSLTAAASGFVVMLTWLGYSSSSRHSLSRPWRI